MAVTRPTEIATLDQSLERVKPKVATLGKSLGEAFAPETATAEVLNAVPGSAAAAQPVFDAIAQRAAVDPFGEMLYRTVTEWPPFVRRIDTGKPPKATQRFDSDRR